MTLATWRDLVIVIWGLVCSGALIFICIVSYRFYKRTVSLLESADLVLAKASDVIDYADKQLIRPVNQIGTIIQGIFQGISLVSNLFRKKEGKR